MNESTANAKSASELVAEARRVVRTCTPVQAARLLSGEPKPMIIDLRELAEFRRGALPGAIHLPRGLLEFQIAKICPLAQQALLVHCAGGGRAVLAAKTLADMGYGNVTAVDGKFSDLLESIAESDTL